MQAGKAQGTTSADVSHSLVVPLRASPTVTLTNHRVFRYDDLKLQASILELSKKSTSYHNKKDFYSIFRNSSTRKSNFS